MSSEAPNPLDPAADVPGNDADATPKVAESTPDVAADAVPAAPPLPAPTTADPAIADALSEPVVVPEEPATPVEASSATPSPAAAGPDVDPAPPVAESARAAESPADAVERALADAVAGSPARATAEPVVADAETVATPAIPEVAAAETETVAAPIIAEPVPPVAPVAAPVAVEPTPTVVAAPVAPVAPVVYAQPLEEPRAVGNRLSGVLIGLLSTVIFAAAFWGLRFVYGFTFANEFPGGIVDSTDLLGDAGYWGAVIGFFVGTVIVALLVNRGGWWAHLLLGLLIAVFAYAGFIGGDLFGHRNEIYTDEVGQAILDRLIAPMALIAFILGREIPIWFGLWTSALGRRAKARTAQAREEYEREVHG